jgi:hypothetical protein
MLRKKMAGSVNLPFFHNPNNDTMDVRFTLQYSVAKLADTSKSSPRRTDVAPKRRYVASREGGSRDPEPLGTWIPASAGMT